MGLETFNADDEKGNYFSSAITVVAVIADVPTENAWEAHHPVALGMPKNVSPRDDPSLAEEGPHTWSTY